MEILLSGLLGALFATILTLMYNHVSDKSKVRADVLMEVVSYCDEIYLHLIEMQTHRNAKYVKEKSFLNQEEYNLKSRRLNSLLISSKPGAKLNIAYGEGEIMALYNSLTSHFLSVSGKLREAGIDTWEKDKAEISSIFEQEIDPLKIRLLTILSKKTKYTEIMFSNLSFFTKKLVDKIKQLLNRLICRTVNRR